ncbi:hypothetical protein [Embleya sp. NPDC050493]|uniref:hypothetical protein n=1 Tax=Embleya sp. NPDC050493 TaxID=3363989 RepID=UPI00379EE643
MEELVGMLLGATVGRFIRVDDKKYWARQRAAFDEGREVQTRAYVFGDPGSGRSFPKPPEGGLGLSRRQLAIFPFEASPLLLRRTLPLDRFSVDVLRDRTDANPGWQVREWRIAECVSEGRPLLVFAHGEFLRLLQDAVVAARSGRD